MGDKPVISSPVVMSASAGSTPQAVAVKKSSAAASIKSKKPSTKSIHPKTADMVNTAILSLNERSGSSLQAIKKYIVSTYKVDTEKQSPYIRKYLRAAVTSGILVQTKGKGAAGSFKLATTKRSTSKPKVKAVTGKPVTPKKTVKKVTAAKKTSVAKKVPAKKVKAIGEKRKVAKGPAAKPPKAKITKAKVVAKSPPKKAAPVKEATSAVSKSKRTTPKKTVIKKK